MTDHHLTFNNGQTANNVSISIFESDEDLAEEAEVLVFLVSLSFPGEPVDRVVLEPSNATVGIFTTGQGKEVFLSVHSLLVVKK